jgi:hypothetical protein
MQTVCDGRDLHDDERDHNHIKQARPRRYALEASWVWVMIIIPSRGLL